MPRVLLILLLAALAACAARPGVPVPLVAAERAALAAQDTARFWQQRAARGDPVAPAALSAMRQRRGAMAAAGRFSFAVYRGAQPQPAPETAISLALAQAHAEALTRDRDGTPALLSARQIAFYHHRVLARFGLPPFAFGATQLTGRAGEARLLAPLWCRGCDRAP